MKIMKRRVVVTGTGLVTPLGTGTEKTWHNLCEGKSGIGPITRFDTTDFGVKIAAEVKDFNAEDYIEPKLARHLDLFVQYAVATAGMALKEANLTLDDTNASRVGVFTGNGIGGLTTIEKYHQIASRTRPPQDYTVFYSHGHFKHECGPDFYCLWCQRAESVCDHSMRRRYPCRRRSFPLNKPW